MLNSDIILQVCSLLINKLVHDGAAHYSLDAESYEELKSIISYKWPDITLTTIIHDHENAFKLFNIEIIVINSQYRIYYGGYSIIYSIRFSTRSYYLK